MSNHNKYLDIYKNNGDLILIISYENLQIEYQITIKFIIFGSENSNDIDIAIIIPENIYDILMENNKINNIIKYLDRELKKNFNDIKWKYIPNNMNIKDYVQNNNGETKDLNCTIISGSEHNNNLVCTRSYKGPIDETNNSFSTFNLHPQMFESNPFTSRVKRNISYKCSFSLSGIFETLYNDDVLRPENNEEEWKNNQKIILYIFEKTISRIKEMVIEMSDEKKCTIAESIFSRHVLVFLAHCFTMYINDPCIHKIIKYNPFKPSYKGSYIYKVNILWNGIINDINNVELINKNLEEITILFNERFKYEVPIFYDPTQNTKELYTHSLHIPRLVTFIKRYANIEMLIVLINKINFNNIILSKNNKETKNKLKRYCFQIAQSHSLLLGYFNMINDKKEYIDTSYELFTKNKAIEAFNHFDRFIMRENITKQDLFYLEFNLKVFLKDFTKFLQIEPASELKATFDSKLYSLKKHAEEYLYINKEYPTYV